MALYLSAKKEREKKKKKIDRMKGKNKKTNKGR
jgi:hypothetical protein